ncbi:UDP-glucose dehydrogenase family protein [Desulfoluna butyratoxydans]|uniref:UDP-glucose 6-dehydrogenase n=1 Tax=Desulfoluna butyratoxydans TaxID=231438 RepID=A0A4U8YXG1_9BACT|nr:UDP-glucose/GDP-mannose dehydrogenase family protein [Desulfoluna butyratoxydans]VFQ46143.1 udp-glucose/gdp-mannose dehydrogenase [Desulfoluna butyratoxydans]
MKITVVGTGYVGLVTGACFSEMGNTVTCVDVDRKKLENLERGILPIYEPGLDGIVKDNYKNGFLLFSDSLEASMKDASIVFIAVGTPPKEDGSADLQHVLAVASEIGKCMNDYTVVVNKSTVPVGTAEHVTATINKVLENRGAEVEFDVVSNPEFLKEGDAVNDFMKPDRIILGIESKKAESYMKELYSPFNRNHDKVQVMGIKDAEMTKYAANSMLATKISFMNEIACICERLGVDVENVRKGIGSDTRIGYSFIYPGCGYGGSCFPKDVKALIRTSRENDFEPTLLDAVESRNASQKNVLFKKIVSKFGSDLSGKSFGIWGLAFKPGTDDMREASSIVLITSLIEAGATVRAYDPQAMGEALEYFDPTCLKEQRLILAQNQYDAVTGADAMVLVTEWKQFRQPDYKALQEEMTGNVIFDGRNQYSPEFVKSAGFHYIGIGR